MAKQGNKSSQKKARTSNFYVSCLNIVLHPHSAKKYVELFKKIFDSKLEAKVHGDNALMLGSFYEVTDANVEGGVYAGNIYKFLKLDKAEDWFNTLKMDSATREDVSGISIPDYLKPHFKKTQYVFFPKNHRLYFVTAKTGHSLSPNLLKRFFESIAERDELAGFGELKVTVQPEDGTADRLFSIPRITLIEMEINKPNPDDHGDLDEDVLERLKELNAGRERRQYVEATSSGLKPDRQLKALATIAAENGEVYVKGRDNGKVVEINSKEHPLKKSTSYNPDIQTELDALLERAEVIHRELAKRAIR